MTAGQAGGSRRILVAIDGSENAGRAAKVAVGRAKRNAASLFILHVIPKLILLEGNPPAQAPATRFADEYGSATKRIAENWVRHAVTPAESEGVSVRGEIVENISFVTQTIVDYASWWKIDLIAMGTRGPSGLKKLLMGRVSDGVLSHAPCSVLVVS